MWYGFFAPKGTPADVVERLNREIVAILDSPEAKTAFEKQGLIPATSTPAALGEIAVRDRDAMGRHRGQARHPARVDR